jgi:hypothetical protein
VIKQSAAIIHGRLLVLSSSFSHLRRTLVQWCGLRASMGKPWTHVELRGQAEAISGKTVGQNWHRKFERRHPELCAAKPAKLDPKRAKHFNEMVVGDFYDQ